MIVHSLNVKAYMTDGWRARQGRYAAGMTAHPTPGNLGHWWLTTRSWRRLHAIPATELATEDLDADIEGDNDGVAGRAACGLDSRFLLPGVLSRLGMPRCVWCCRALGILAGNGTPTNERARVASTSATPTAAGLEARPPSGGG
jgi:hypothetical protein